MNKSAFQAPKPDALVCALVESGIDLTPQASEAIKAKLDQLLFRGPRWWGAWQTSAMSGKELRDALLQHAHLALEKFAAGKVPFDRFGALETPFEQILFGASLQGDEPANCDGAIG